MFKSTQSLTSSCFSFGRKTHMRSIVLLYKYCHFKGKKFSAVGIQLLILTNNLWQRQSLRSITMSFVTCITCYSPHMSRRNFFQKLNNSIVNNYFPINHKEISWNRISRTFAKHAFEADKDTLGFKIVIISFSSICRHR